jgi:hypothetical protein
LKILNLWGSLFQQISTKDKTDDTIDQFLGDHEYHEVRGMYHHHQLRLGMEKIKVLYYEFDHRKNLAA